MQYETMKSNQIDFTFESKNFSSIFGLYLFSLGAVFSGYSLYLFLEATESIERKIITWSGQGLFWSLILFFIALSISDRSISEKAPKSSLPSLGARRMFKPSFCNAQL